jgi:hypothetical protein
MVTTASAVGQVAALRHDAFEPEPAGVLQDGRSVMLGEMLAEANACGRAGENLLEQRLAVQKDRLTQIKALAIEKIERVVAHAILPALAQVGLQIAQARFSGVVLDHDLAVDQAGAQAQCLERLLMLLKRSVQSRPVRVRSLTLPPSMRA